MSRAKQSFHSPYSSNYDAEQDFDERSFWSREAVVEMDINFKVAMCSSDEWKTRLKACAEG